MIIPEKNLFFAGSKLVSVSCQNNSCSLFHLVSLQIGNFVEKYDPYFPEQLVFHV